MMIAYLPADDPEIAIGISIEYGGYGARAGDLVVDIANAYFAMKDGTLTTTVPDTTADATTDDTAGDAANDAQDTADDTTAPAEDNQDAQTDTAAPAEETAD